MVLSAILFTPFRLVSSLSLIILVMAQFIGSDAADQPEAFVYRGPTDDPDLSSAVGELLESSPRNFSVRYVGPDDITPQNLQSVKVFAYPGGPDVGDAWKELEPIAPAVRDYVAKGGRYIGFCLGAYLAGDSPGFALLPQGTSVSAECDEDGAQVRDHNDTIIQVNWAFSSGADAGKTVNNRWIYYQEGNLVKGLVENATTHVLARYSQTGHVAATLSKYGDGWVGTTGPHPEANQHWFDVENLKSPDGLQFGIGHDLIEATMTGGEGFEGLGTNVVTGSTASKTPAASRSNKLGNPLRRLFRR